MKLISTLTRKAKILIGVGLCAVVGAIAFHSRSSKLPFPSQNGFTKNEIANALGELVQQADFPERVDISNGSRSFNGRIEYTIDEQAQDRIESIIERYHPDYAAFVAIDAKTGRVLSLASYNHGHPGFGDLAVRSTFPTASVFKIVTATAAIDQKIASIDTRIPFNGSYHTLYKRNVERNVFNRWTHYLTLRQAFAQSVNTVFGKLGLFRVGPDKLRHYANGFLFNQSVNADFPVMMGLANISDNDRWELAQASSGFTHHDTTMSPVQGALIAAAVANNGVMMAPTLVDSIYDKSGNLLYRWKPQVASVTMQPATAAEMRAMMRATIQSGTSRRTFYRVRREHHFFSAIEVGAKTGHLTGDDPKGHYDWFVGYANGFGQTIAVAALTINIDKWQVKSSRLAGDFMAAYYKDLQQRDPGSVATYQANHR